MDSTGLESRHGSAYDTRRCRHHRGHVRHRYPRLSAAVDPRSHLFLAAVVDRGPRPDDLEFHAVVRQARGRCGVADPRRRPYWRPCQEDLKPRQMHKRGSKWLRWVLVEAAVPATRSNLALKSLYDRVCRKKGPLAGPNVAKVAVARKLAEIVYRILVEERPYEIR